VVGLGKQVVGLGKQVVGLGKLVVGAESGGIGLHWVRSGFGLGSLFCKNMGIIGEI
jgi:hypothetical protein